jgi:hypothetical protein
MLALLLIAVHVGLVICAIVHSSFVHGNAESVAYVTQSLTVNVGGSITNFRKVFIQLLSFAHFVVRAYGLLTP